MENTNKTDGKTSTESCFGVTEKQRGKMNKMADNYWFAILDCKEQDFESVHNVTYDTLEGAKRLLKGYKKDFPDKKFKLFKEVSN